MTVGGDSCRLPETGIATINARIDADVRAAGLRILQSQVNRVSSLASNQGGQPVAAFAEATAGQGRARK